MRVSARAGLAVLGAAAAALALAQAPGIKRTILQRTDAAPEHECVFGTAELAPGAASGKHIHHGVELGYVIEGQLDLTVEGESAPRHLKAGDSFRMEVRKPHDARNTGSGTLKVISAWVVEKGKPLAEPVK